MAKLNQVPVDEMNLITEKGIQKVAMVLDGNVREKNTRQFLWQVAKESEGFRILELR